MACMKTRRWLVALMAVVAVLTALGLGASASRKSKANLASKLKANVRKQQVIQHQIRIKDMQAKDVTGQLSRVELQLADAQTNLAQNKLKLLSAQDLLQRTTERLERTKAQLKRRQGLLEQRVVDIYEGDDIQYVNVVLGSTTMWSFLTNAYYLQAILDSDTELISQIQADKQQIEADQQRQAQTVERIAGIQVSLESERNQVADLDTKSQQLDQIEHSKDCSKPLLMNSKPSRTRSKARSGRSRAHRREGCGPEKSWWAG